MHALRFAALASVLVAAACAREAQWPPAPLELTPGDEACAECRMFVSDERFAVQVHSPAGSVAWFDDIGCLLLRPGGVTDPRGVLVRDFASDAWVRGDAGFAAHVPGSASPMGFGWRVHASREAAREWSAEASELLPLPDLLRRGIHRTARPLSPTTSGDPGRNG